MNELIQRDIETEHHLIKSVAKGGGILFAGESFHMGSNFILHILLARFLGSSNYGLYALGFSFITILSKLSNLGLQNGIVRFGAMYKGEKDIRRLKGTLVSAYLMSISFSIFTATLLFIFSSSLAANIFKKPDLAGVLKIFSLSLPFFVFMTMTAYTARAFQKMHYDVGIKSFSQPLIDIALVTLALILGLGLYGTLYAFLFSAVFSSGLGLYFIFKIFPELKESIKSIYENKKLLRFSIPILFIGFTYILLNEINRIMLGYFRPSSEVGIYNAAAKVAILVSLFNQAFNGIFAPIISDLYNKNETKKLDMLFKTTTRWIVSLTLPTAFIMIFFSKNILPSVFGSEYLSGWAVLSILSGCFIFTTGTGSVGFLLQMSGKQDIELINTVATLLVNIGLNIWLIPRYGIIGAAWATGLSLILINIIKLIEVHFLLKMQPYDQKYLKPLLAMSIPIFAGIALKNLTPEIFETIWPVIMVILVIIYFLLLFLFGFSEEDQLIIKTIKTKLRGPSRNE